MLTNALHKRNGIGSIQFSLFSGLIPKHLSQKVDTSGQLKKLMNV